MEHRGILENFRRKAKSAGLKVTPQRVAVYMELVLRKDHPCAEELYESLRKKMEGISLATVYRTLSSLEKAGLVFKVPTFEDRVRYDARLERHSHFVCIRCGRVKDVDCAPAPQNLNTNGALVSGCFFVCYGVCELCRQKES